MPLQQIDTEMLAALNEIAQAMDSLDDPRILRAELARVKTQRDALIDALQFAHDVLWADHAINTTPEGRRAIQAVNKARTALSLRTS